MACTKSEITKSALSEKLHIYFVRAKSERNKKKVMRVFLVIFFTTLWHHDLSRQFYKRARDIRGDVARITF